MNLGLPTSIAALLTLAACGGQVDTSSGANGSDAGKDAGGRTLDSAVEAQPRDVAAGETSEAATDAGLIHCPESLDAGTCSAENQLCDTFGAGNVDLCTLADVPKAIDLVCSCSDDVVTRRSCSGGTTLVTFTGVHSGGEYYFAADGHLIAVFSIPFTPGSTVECQLGPAALAAPDCGDASTKNLCELDGG
jgi:hypothetical protein